VPDNFINDANEAIRLFNKQDFSNTKKFLKKVIPVYPSKGFFDNLYGAILSLENNDLNSIDFFNNAILHLAGEMDNNFTFRCDTKTVTLAELKPLNHE